MDTATTHGITHWSRGGTHRADPRLLDLVEYPATLTLEEDGRFYAGTIAFSTTGTAMIDLVSPRPIRIWMNETLVCDEVLFWRWYEREVRAAIILPCVAGTAQFVVEVGPRSTWHPHLDTACPSRNRETVRRALRECHPDILQWQMRVAADVAAPGCALRFLPSQYHDGGVTWQLVRVRPIAGDPVRACDITYWSPVETAPSPIELASPIAPGHAREVTPEEEARHGLRRYYVPVTDRDTAYPPLREAGAYDGRVEPSLEICRQIPLTVAGGVDAVTIAMPVFESLGRQAPQRAYRHLAWPTYEEACPTLPEPIVPTHRAWLRDLYDATWSMLYGLVRDPAPESGLPNAYIRTAGQQFEHHQFVWDSAFTAMCTAYGWRALPAYATLDLLYSRQFDGGYIHREHDTRDGVPAAFEPDFSPNPPILSLAEWAIAGLTGDTARLATVYPILRDLHCWLRANRRLPDGTYWTTGLANGLDNSPSLGDGYPDLTAQMAHDAETLGRIARVLGREDEAEQWGCEAREIAQALNAHLWDETQQIYATSLLDGGHNPNKVVTAFWPLWAGVVPSERVTALAEHLKDPRSFWRHHPVPSLAADSPHYRPDGQYWLGSTWAPTNYATIKGFDRVGRHDLAVETAYRHLTRLHEVWRDTGHLWENYCAERSTPGNVAGPDYCWTALGPIALLFEVIIGLRADALNATVQWTLPDEPGFGVRRLALGNATITLHDRLADDGRRGIVVETDAPFTLEVDGAGTRVTRHCAPGRSWITLGE